MTVIPLAAISLKNMTHLHGITAVSSTVRSSEKIKAVLFLESGAIMITSEPKDTRSVRRVYMVHLSDAYFIEPADDKWAAKFTAWEVPTDPAKPAAIAVAAKKI